MLRHLAIGLLLCLLALAPARAGEAALVSFKVMSPELALELAQATLESCRKSGFQVAVVVVDRSGILQVALRDRFAGPHTVETARRKAWTAVSFRTDTEGLADFSQAGKPPSGVRFVEGALMIGGGVPVAAAGSLVGAVGVSGAPGGKADDTCARDGIARITDKLEF
jgi:uncharacterized protein GlcG (DUF336 family)